MWYLKENKIAVTIKKHSACDFCQIFIQQIFLYIGQSITVCNMYTYSIYILVWIKLSNKTTGSLNRYSVAFSANPTNAGTQPSLYEYEDYTNPNAASDYLKSKRDECIFDYATANRRYRASCCHGNRQWFLGA